MHECDDRLDVRTNSFRGCGGALPMCANTIWTLWRAWEIQRCGGVPLSSMTDWWYISVEPRASSWLVTTTNMKTAWKTIHQPPPPQIKRTCTAGRREPFHYWRCVWGGFPLWRHAGKSAWSPGWRYQGSRAVTRGARPRWHSHFPGTPAWSHATADGGRLLRCSPVKVTLSLIRFFNHTCNHSHKMRWEG